MRISLLDGKYQVIKAPAGIELTPDPKLYLGRSQKGVYCALDDYCVYILDVSYGKMEWVQKASIGLSALRHRQTDTRPKPCDEYQDRNDEVIMEQNFELGNNAVETKEWDSDDDNVIGTKDWDDSNFGGDITFLGFHPYKEVVFLSEGLRRGLAYHLNTSKVQDLGNLSPTHYGNMGIEPFIEGSFPYTLVWKFHLIITISGHGVKYLFRAHSGKHSELLFIWYEIMKVAITYGSCHAFWCLLGLFAHMLNVDITDIAFHICFLW